MADLQSAEVKLYIYDGDINNPPPDPNYTLKKTILSEDTHITFEISELIKDHVEIEFDGNYDGLKQTKWVKYTVTRTYDDATEDSYNVHAIAFRGYGELIDGINPELSKTLMVSNTVINNYCGEIISVPFYTRPDGVTKVIYADGSTDLSSEAAGSANRYTIAQELRINPPLDDIVKIDKTASVTVAPDNSTSVDEAPIDTDKITFTDSEGNQTSINIECIKECKNEPYKISFINKFGVMQDIWFFAKRTDNVSSERDSYKRAILKTGKAAASFNIGDHQNVYLENQGRERITLNTGFIHPSYNEVIKQLLVSEYVYIHDKNRMRPTNGLYNLAVPVTVVTNSLDFKTRRNDKLINYELQFDSDSAVVQNIR